MRGGGCRHRRRGGGSGISPDRRRLQCVRCCTGRRGVCRVRRSCPRRRRRRSKPSAGRKFSTMPVRRLLKDLRIIGTRTSPSSNPARFSIVERTALARSALAFREKAGGDGPRRPAIALAQRPGTRRLFASSSMASNAASTPPSTPPDAPRHGRGPSAVRAARSPTYSKARRLGPIARTGRL